MIEIICTSNFVRYWRRSRLTESGLIEIYCILIFTLCSYVVLMVLSYDIFQ